MDAQPQQIDIQKLTDLELADLLQSQMAVLFQAQNNFQQLQAELARRKEAVKQSEKGINK